MSPIERFWNFVALPAHLHNCWEWTGYTNPYGHISISSNGDVKTVSAHRFAYEHFHGAVPEGLHVCHSCDNPKCVSPFHLWAGTNADNRQDMVNKGRKIGKPSGKRIYALPLGVSPHGKKFKVRKRNRWIGTFNTPEEAHAAYLAAH